MMFDFGDDPSASEVLRKVVDLLRRQFPSAGHWRQLVCERLERMATDLDSGRLVYRSGSSINEKTCKEMEEYEAYRNKLQAQEQAPLAPKVELPTISGWSPPIMYDVQLDNFRLVTQTDIEIFLSLGREWAMLFESVQRHQQNHRDNVMGIMKEAELFPEESSQEINSEKANQ